MKRKYYYHVAYHFGSGHGDIEIVSCGPIDTREKINTARETIKEQSGEERIIIYSIFLLRKEPLIAYLWRWFIDGIRTKQPEGAA